MSIHYLRHLNPAPEVQLVLHSMHPHLSIIALKGLDDPKLWARHQDITLQTPKQLLGVTSRAMKASVSRHGSANSAGKLHSDGIATSIHLRQRGLRNQLPRPTWRSDGKWQDPVETFSSQQNPVLKNSNTRSSNGWTNCTCEVCDVQHRSVYWAQRTGLSACNHSRVS